MNKSRSLYWEEFTNDNIMELFMVSVKEQITFNMHLRPCASERFWESSIFFHDLEAKEKCLKLPAKSAKREKYTTHLVKLQSVK